MAILTLRPNAAGDETNLIKSGTGGDNYDRVDEVISDGGTTYVTDFADADWIRDFYNIENSSGSGQISKIAIYAVVYAWPIIWVPTQASLKINCKAGSTVDEGDGQAVTNVYDTYSEEWASNPDDGQGWEWTYIDSLQIGISLRKPNAIAASMTMCTQVYVDVEYTPPIKQFDNSGLPVAGGKQLESYEHDVKVMDGYEFKEKGNKYPYSIMLGL